MCPSRINTTSGTHTTPTMTPNMQPRHHRNPSHNKKQNTLWNFIYAKIHEGPATIGVPETLTPPETTPDSLHLTPPANLPQQEEAILSQSVQQTSLLPNKNNDPWGDADEYNQTHDYS